jgi:lipopolysaccharide/colanic/teichoic acid biosynthesis glycosyltransferase
MKRLVDVVVSALGALVLAPVATAIAAAVWCGSGPPVLFRQQRAGRHGEPFTILKFRTMRPATHPGEPDVDRTTAVGRLLRSSSLDEIPQLWNILRGDMTLVGPRPTLPEQVVHYSERQRGRLAVRPGLTGWAQVRGRNALSWPERIDLDLWYVAHRSLLLDLRIVALTVLHLLRPSGITGAGGQNPGFPHATDTPVPPPIPLRHPSIKGEEVEYL